MKELKKMKKHKFEIQMISKDNHTFNYKCLAINEDDAKQQAKNRIIEKGWEIYRYKIKHVTLLK